MGIVTLTIQVNEEVYRALEQRARKEQRDVAALAEEWIESLALEDELPPPAESLRRGWQDMRDEKTVPLSDIWTGIDAA